MLPVQPAVRGPGVQDLAAQEVEAAVGLGGLAAQAPAGEPTASWLRAAGRLYSSSPPTPGPRKTSSPGPPAASPCPSQAG